MIQKRYKNAIDIFSTALSNGTFLAFILYAFIFIVYVIKQGSFAISPYGIKILCNSSIVLAIAAVAETFVVLSGGFDLSVAGIVVLTNTIIAVGGGSLGYGGEFTSSSFGFTGSLVFWFVLSIAIGAVVGAINGFLVAFMKLQSIAATLGSSIVCSGIALLVLPQPGGNVPRKIVDIVDSSIGHVPTTAIIAIVVGTIAWIILRKTKFGIGLYSVGQDRNAAHLSGINVRRVEFLAFLFAGIFSGLSGFMLSAHTGTGSPQLPPSFLLLTFAAVAIGGTSFQGGRGSVIGSIIGACILAVLQKTLFALGVASFYRGMFQGLIMICAVLLGSISVILEKKYKYNEKLTD